MFHFSEDVPKSAAQVTHFLIMRWYVAYEQMTSAICFCRNKNWLNLNNMFPKKVLAFKNEKNT